MIFRTVSVARSFDETTIQPPTRCYHPESHYESKSQYSHKTNDVRNIIILLVHAAFYSMALWGNYTFNIA
jgi:hypothetical protein